MEAAPTTITMVESDELPTIADDLVVTKYKMSAEIVNSKDIYNFEAALLTIYPSNLNMLEWVKET